MDESALRAILERNKELAAEVEMLKRLVAILLTQSSSIQPDPDRFLFETVEKMRAALHVTDDPAHRATFEIMEHCLDDVARVARMVMTPVTTQPE